MRKVLMLFAVAVAMVGCSDRAITTAPVGQARATASDSRDPILEANTRKVTRAIALALSDQGSRQMLRDAWRDSRTSSDHKVVLQDWFALPQSRPLLAQAAGAIGSSPEQLLQDMRALPQLDFYVPIRKHRQTWKATDDILVGFTFNQDADTAEAFRVDGSPVTLYGPNVSEGSPVIILHPAEPKPIIKSKRPLTRDEVIEPAWTRGPRQSTLVVAMDGLDPEEPIADCDPYCDFGEGGGGGGGSGSPPAGVYITYFDALRDDGPLGGDLEMQFETFGWNANPPTTPSLLQVSATWAFTSTCFKGSAVGDFDHDRIYSGMYLRISPDVTTTTLAGCTGSSTLKGYGVQAWEMDGGLNGNDDFGKRYYTVGTNPSSDFLPFGLFFSSTTGHDFWSASGNPDPYSGYYAGNPEWSLHLQLQVF